jgi:hypothetical protein
MALQLTVPRSCVGERQEVFRYFGDTGHCGRMKCYPCGGLRGNWTRERMPRCNWHTYEETLAAPAVPVPPPIHLGAGEPVGK